MAYDEDDECIHGLDPTTCSLCQSRRRAAEAPKVPPKPVRIPRPAPPKGQRPPKSTPGPKVAARAGAATPAGGGRLASRKDYFADVAAPALWWIDQTGVADEQWAEGVVAASADADGSVPPTTRNVGELRAGDRTVHVVGGEVVAVGLVVGDGRAVNGAASPTWLAEVALDHLEQATDVKGLPMEIKWAAPPPGPFTRQGFVVAGTCFPLDPKLAGRLATRFKVTDAAWATMAPFEPPAPAEPVEQAAEPTEESGEDAP